MRFRAKLTLLLAGITVVTVGMAGLVLQARAESQLRGSILSRLESITLLKESQYEQWSTGRRIDVELLARDTRLRESILAAASTDGSDDRDPRAVARLELELHEAMEAAGGLRRLYVIDAGSGRVNATTDPSLADTFRTADPEFAAALVQTDVAAPRWSLPLQETIKVIATPVRGVDGNTVAVLAAHVDLSALQEILMRGQDATNSQDSYLVNEFNFFLTDARYADEAAGRQAIRTDGVERCLQGQTGLGRYLDYRGVDVLGAYRWIPDREACLLTEIDASEALAPVASLQRELLQLTGLLALAAALVAAAAARHAARPVAQLREGVGRFAQGDLDHRIDLQRADELGDLAHAMDDMAEALQRTTASRDALLAEIALRQEAQALERLRTEELARSNEDLQQFAYVASHDLQEPLRMVSSYVQLLQRRYAGQLDDDADDFINYAVDGTIRMKALINDLLTYSRLETRARPSVPVRVADVMRAVVADLGMAIADAGGDVEVDVDDAWVLADEHQVRQLFQNLVSNALKFRSDEPPRVSVTAQALEGSWQFAVRDNGIGIADQHFDRVFVIFQRLRDRDDASGTGIGLAVCRKIVERHGGRIWIESTPGEGSTFNFTLPCAAPEPGRPDVPVRDVGHTAVV